MPVGENKIQNKESKPIVPKKLFRIFMKHNILKSILLTTLLLSTASGLAKNSEKEWMKVANRQVMVNDKLCYLIKKGYSITDTTNWETFCGVLHNFYYEEGNQRTLYVKKYDPQADTIHATGEFMRVANHRVTVDDKRCYLVKNGHNRKDTTNWKPFCGEFTNFYYIEGYQRTMLVEKYDPQADTIHVIKEITRDSIDPVKKQKELRRKRARWDSIKAASESPVTEPDNKEK